MSSEAKTNETKPTFDEKPGNQQSEALQRGNKQITTSHSCVGRRVGRRNWITDYLTKKSFDHSTSSWRHLYIYHHLSNIVMLKYCNKKNTDLRWSKRGSPLGLPTLKKIYINIYIYAFKKLFFPIICGYSGVGVSFFGSCDWLFLFRSCYRAVQ